MEWKEWTGKKIFVKLRTGDVYNGIVEEVKILDGKVIWFDITDKFGMRVSFPHTEVIKMREEK